MANLIAFSGLPGTGKTTISRILARRIGAVHLRVDTMEAAMKRSTLKIQDAGDAGYLALAAVAGDNLALGFDVIADTVNPVATSRVHLAATAHIADANLLNVELICSDPVEHRRRVEARTNDIDGLVLPDWGKVLAREYEPWNEPVVVIDTAQRSPEECAAAIAAHITVGS